MKNWKAKRQLYLLHEERKGFEKDPEESLNPVELEDNRLFRAGFFTQESQITAIRLRTLLICTSSVSGTTLGLMLNHPYIGAINGAYLGFFFWLALVRYRTKNVTRRLLLELPMLLESLILLVDSGLGLLPALNQLVLQKNKETSLSLPRYLFGAVHELSGRGMPFSYALKFVSERCAYRSLRHVFLHLDIAGNEGGALVPSLRNLASFAHNEWKHSVEIRVKRLENLVVFPVFGAVIGLILLTAAVPIVPLIELGERLDKQELTTGEKF